MNKAVNLLRMLEPVVRPVTQPGASARGATEMSGVAEGGQPFESRSFESLLSGASQGDPAVQGELSTSGDAKPHPLASLQGLDAITNVSLRELIQSSLSIQADSASDDPSVGTQGVTP